MRTRSFIFKGVTPMLIHANDVQSQDLVKAWRTAPEHKNLVTPGDDRTPPWTWQTYLYNDGEYLAMPCINIMTCIRKAATSFSLKGAKTFKELSQAGMWIPSEFCELLINGKQVRMADVTALRDLPFTEQSNATRDLGFQLDVRRVKVGTKMWVRVRPKLANWVVRGQFEIVAPELTDQLVTDMVTLAGRVGLCDWRPGCPSPGSWGIFNVEFGK